MLKPQSTRLLDIDSSPEQMKMALLETKTDLIIATQPYTSQEEMTSEQLRLAAPVIEIDWIEMGWKDHLRSIAKAVGKTKLALQWLAAFEVEEQEAKATIQQLPIANETITIVVFKPNELLVYGARNAGYVLYQSLGLRPPTRIQQQLNEHGERFHSLLISFEELPTFICDRLFVILFADEKGSIAHAEKIFSSAIWKELPAVQRNRVHLLDQNDWIPYNPVSIRRQLQRAVSLLSEASQ